MYIYLISIYMWLDGKTDLCSKFLFDSDLNNHIVNQVVFSLYNTMCWLLTLE